eukprot:1158348-Pelagomonas_calceolata.AAC.1
MPIMGNDSVMYANKLLTTGRAIENKNFTQPAQGPRAGDKKDVSDVYGDDKDKHLGVKIGPEEELWAIFGQHQGCATVTQSLRSIAIAGFRSMPNGLLKFSKFYCLAYGHRDGIASNASKFELSKKCYCRSVAVKRR